MKPRTTPAAAPSEGGQSRSPGGYPFYSLNVALLVGRAVSEMGGARTVLSEQLIAKQMMTEDGTPSFKQKLASAKVFGIIEPRGSSRWMLTRSGIEYFSPVDDAQKRRALLDFIARPPVFQQLIRSFDGQRLPENKQLANFLFQQRLAPESWKARVASIFSEAAKESDLIDPNGILRHSASVESHAANPSNGITTDPLIYHPHNPATPPERQERMPESRIFDSEQAADTSVWNMSEGSITVKVVTPSNMSRSLWLKLKAYVSILEPSGEDDLLR